MVLHALGGHTSWNEIRSSRRNLFLNPRHLVVPNAFLSFDPHDDY